MDEMSWRARLARKNINILNIDDERWYYEFMYHPRPGQTKWCKTFYEIPSELFVPHDKPWDWVKLHETNIEKIVDGLEGEVLSLRKELEG